MRVSEKPLVAGKKHEESGLIVCACMGLALLLLLGGCMHSRSSLNVVDQQKGGEQHVERRREG